MSDIRAILQVAHGSEWLCLEDPVRIVEAHDRRHVREALCDVERAARTEGRYAAGWVSYEAAAAFGLPVLSAAADDVPLVWFAIFDPGTVRAIARPTAGAAYHLRSLRPSISVSRFNARLTASTNVICAIAQE